MRCSATSVFSFYGRWPARKNNIDERVFEFAFLKTQGFKLRMHTTVFNKGKRGSSTTVKLFMMAFRESHQSFSTISKVPGFLLVQLFLFSSHPIHALEIAERKGLSEGPSFHEMHWNRVECRRSTANAVNEPSP